MTIGVIIQARTKSFRFPRKIYEDINGTYTLQRVLAGVTSNKLPDKIILAMPVYDEPEFLQRKYNGEFDKYIDNRFDTYFGHPDDLVDRYYNASLKFNIDIIVRITADCPLGGTLVDPMIDYYKSNCINGFLGNLSKMSDCPYPDGMGVEIFPLSVLKDTFDNSKTASDREHVTFFMYKSKPQRCGVFDFRNEHPNKTISMRFPNFSFDTKEDLDLIKKIAINYDITNDLDTSIKMVK